MQQAPPLLVQTYGWTSSTLGLATVATDKVQAHFVYSRVAEQRVKTRQPWNNVFIPHDLDETIGTFSWNNRKKWNAIEILRVWTMVGQKRLDSLRHNKQFNHILLKKPQGQDLPDVFHKTDTKRPNSAVRRICGHRSAKSVQLWVYWHVKRRTMIILL